MIFKKRVAKYPAQSIMSQPSAPDIGYVSATTILSDLVLIQFSVPCPAWNELEESEEWKAFVALLERHQEEYSQKRHTVVGCRQEV